MMLFLTLGNIVLCTVQWLSGLFRQRQYGLAMNRILRTSSFFINRAKKSLSESVRRPSLFPLGSSSNEKLEYEDDYIKISSADVMYEIDLSTWTSYTSYLESHTKLPGPEENIYIMLEAKRPRDVEKFADKALAVPPAHRVNVLKHGCPVAWKSAEPFGIILQCSFGGLVILTDAFGQGHLSLDEDLQLIRIISVKTKGTPQKLVPLEDNYPMYKSEEDLQNSCIQDELTPNTNLLQHSSNTEETTPIISNKYSQRNNEHSSDAVQSFSKSSVDQDVNAKEPSATSNNETQPFIKKPTKPPNILVYCGIKDTARIFANIKSSLEMVINTEAYTIYHLTHEALLSAPWTSNAALLIVSSCPQLSTDEENKIQDYIHLHCGRLLSFNCSIDSKFSNKSVDTDTRKNTLIQFKYGNSVVTTFRGPYYYTADNEYAEVIVPLDQGSRADEKNMNHDQNKKCLVLKTCGNGSGVVVLSQLLLERDPADYATDSESFARLKQANADRLEVFRDLLTSLGIDTSPGNIPALTPCLLLVRRVGLKESFLNSIKHRLRDEVLKSKNISLKFVDNYGQETTPSLLPVITSVHCDIQTQFFRLSEYWQNLKTSTLGQVVFYTDVIPTTMTVFDGLIFSVPENIGVIAIAGRQTKGKGRGGNAWLSPLGCAMFTLPIQLSVGTKLAQRVSFLQHMVSLAVVQSVVTLPGYEELDLRLKWPNDIYYGKEMKLGGVLVTSTIMDTIIYASIGCGFNVSNSNPTVCINDVIRLYNTSYPDLPDLPPLSTGQLIARTLTILESLIEEFNRSGHLQFCQQYYRCWLHSGAKVTVQLDQPTQGEIIGLDEHGFLSIQTPDQKLLSVQPDGNSFDMMHNLIYVKST
ncbi:biotin--protein ligase-like [Biomphalaria glabrata]|uniref:Biotin--protein ligase-like n=1 Tax=Biomphalaria glabrata TaxID=6526 RepID=A0A9W3AMC1_BIOGL|nr:biotin--protein ligase-like [Biomphalaria glabrata]XP_055888408.1 biotin--protein ligase-like [Biomphalaria glabrata]XP_055888409.1 biotin--protein ligase-like [Biomphalaria glabrata]XP_055888410.1 biotin--protein ligase-like [Biomphalaria glabrata]XP_055888412.1 biotin--protein ligase-like [Biomphalaria glabrata]XP_055888413.1 biotin--protein ligase-like [Biomphalaria glabrata]